jgi:hypothetical protein
MKTDSGCPSALVVYALGSALSVFTMSLVHIQDTARVPNTTAAQEYSIAVLAKTFGMLFGVPLMTAVWAKSITLGNAALGLPYFASAVRINVLVVPIYLLNKPQLLYVVASVLASKLNAVSSFVDD